MRPPSKETNETLDALNSELQMVMAQLGQDEITEQAREKALARLKQLTEQVYNISKQGDSPEYLINLTEKTYTINRNYCSFRIPGRKDGEPYSVTEITGKSSPLDSGRGGEPNSKDHGWRVKLDSIYISAHRIAADIAREINGDLPPLSSRPVSACPIVKTLGVFVSPSKEPTQALLAKNVAVLEEYCAALIDDGNSIWDKTKDYRMISDLSRWAASYRGISTAWHGNLLNTQVCPGCGDTVRKGVAIHPACGWILDEAKAKENAEAQRRVSGNRQYQQTGTRG